jgi:hypothetical protein
MKFRRPRHDTLSIKRRGTGILARMSEIARTYRDMAARYRAMAESFRLWPDEAMDLIRQAMACEARADAIDRERDGPAPG